MSDARDTRSFNKCTVNSDVMPLEHLTARVSLQVSGLVRCGWQRALVGGCCQSMKAHNPSIERTLDG